MKRNLLLGAAIMASVAVSAQTFNASDWVLNAQGFNKVDGQPVSELSVENNVLTATYPATPAGELSRMEISSKADITMGAGQNVVVFKVDFENCCFQDFDANMISILRQLKEGSADGAELAPYFNSDPNKNAGRMSNPINTQTATTAYYWRDMSTIPAQTGSVDWTNAFTIYGNHFTNTTFNVDGQDIYGRCWLGIRLCHTKNNTNEIGQNATVSIPYIGVTSLEELGAADSSSLDGKMVRAYITAMLEKDEVKATSLASGIAIAVDGNLISAEGAESIEVFNIQGAKVAASCGNAVQAEKGLYIVRASAAGKTSVAKVSVR